MSTPAAPGTPLGVDIANAQVDAAAGIDGTYKTKVFPNTPPGFAAVLIWLRPLAPVHGCLEATGRYGEVLATVLVEHGLTVSVIHPAHLQAFGKAERQRTNTDPGDAPGITRGWQGQQPPAWQPLPPAVRQLQALVRRLDDLTALRQMEHNRHEHADATVQASLTRVLALLDAESEPPRAAIPDHLDQAPDVPPPRAFVDPIPGLGETPRAVLLAALGDSQRFDPAQAVAAFAGLSPAERQSGKYQGQPRLSPLGDGLRRQALYFPAMVASRDNPRLQALCERLKATGKPGKVIICAVLRQLLTLAYGVLKSGQPFKPEGALAN